MATVTYENVSKIFKTRQGEARAVDDLSIEIQEKEMVVLVGPSGCGKTTTLRLLAGLEQPTSGTIKIGERVVNRVEPKDRDIAMVFQNYALYPHMSVFGNMAFGLKMRRVSRNDIRQKVEEAAGLLGIEHLLNRKPKQLSGGERQRVALGRAIVRRPQVFLFDEPLSNLDAKLRVHMRTEIRSLQRKLATTSVYVTHDQEEAMTLADRLVVMKSGVVQQCGTPVDVYNRPSNRFVAGFFGSPPMNFFEGRLDEDGGGMCFNGNKLQLPIPRTCSQDLQGSLSTQVVLGVRAENVLVGEVGSTDAPMGAVQPDGSLAVTASVETVEPLGDRQNVHMLTAGNERLVARVPSQMIVERGQEVPVSFDFSRVHFFEANEQGRRIA